MEDHMRMLKHFPMLVPSYDYKYWEGVLNRKSNGDIIVKICTPNYPSIREMSFEGLPEMQRIKEMLNQIKNFRISSLTDFLLRLQEYEDPPGPADLIQGVIGRKTEKLAANTYSRYSKILSELKDIGSDNVQKVDGELKRLTLIETDTTGYKHRLEIRLPENYPGSSFPVLESVDLPDVVIRQISRSETIRDMYRNFGDAVSQMEEFWRVYDEIRKAVWIIDPEKPRKRDTYCRLVLDKNISSVITINPMDATACPEIQFLGPEKAVAPLRNRLERNLKQSSWNTGWSLVDNLLNLLEIDEFPSPAVTSDKGRPETIPVDDDLLVNSEECAICFALRSSDNMLPAKICNNERCTAVFHVTCLAQWFQAIPTNEPSFDLISGDCPHCGETILCPVRAS